MLWSNRPGSLAIESDSLQGGLGVRYKPLRDQLWYLSAERLFRIGDNAQNSWLLRASYGWSTGSELRVDREDWNYTALFADLGRFTDPARTWAFTWRGARVAVFAPARTGR